MLRRFAAVKAATLNAYNAFCFNVFFVVMVSSLVVLPAQWWVATQCQQKVSRICELGVSISKYWYVGVLVGFAIALLTVVVKWVVAVTRRS